MDKQMACDCQCERNEDGICISCREKADLSILRYTLEMLEAFNRMGEVFSSICPSCLKRDEAWIARKIAESMNSHYQIFGPGAGKDYFDFNQSMVEKYGGEKLNESLIGSLFKKESDSKP